MNRPPRAALFGLLAALLGLRLSLPAAAEEPRAAPQRPPTAPGRPASPRPTARPNTPPGPAARPSYDGRGQVLDSRYHHGRYYPPPGTVTRSLPPDYRPYYRGGSPYYFHAGVWYVPRAGGFVVVSPPPGIV